MIIAGRTFRLKLTDGRTVDLTPTNGDEVRFERLQSTSLTRIVKDGDVPVWVLIGVLHVRASRDGVEVPADPDDFADLIEDLEVVDEGKAEASDPIPPTG